MKGTLEAFVLHHHWEVVDVYREPKDAWRGMYFDEKHGILYVCPEKTLVIKMRLKK